MFCNSPSLTLPHKGPRGGGTRTGRGENMVQGVIKTAGWYCKVAERRHLRANAMANKTSITSRKVAKPAKPRPTVRKSQPRRSAKPTLLPGGNPQIAKACGDAPVQAYIAAMPGWKRDVGRRLDALIARSVPQLRKAVK